MPLRKGIAGWIAVVAWLVACGDDRAGKEYSFERSVQEPVVEKRCVAPEALGTECYLLKWRIPIDTKRLLRVHVWLDTTVIPLNAQDIPRDALKQSLTRDFVSREGVFFDSLDISAEVARYKDRDSLSVALWAEYSGDGIPGRIVRTFVILGDDMPPARVQFRDSVAHDLLELVWNRPTDRVDFYRQDLISGAIVGYAVHLWTDDGSPIGESVAAQLWLAGTMADSLLHEGKYWRVYGRDSVVMTDARSLASERHWVIVDGKGFDIRDSLSNVFSLVISGLRAETRYQVNITAYDLVGNKSVSETPVLRTTDSIAPLVPSRLWARLDREDPGRIRLDSNRVLVWWLRSVDPLRGNTGIILDTVLRIPSSCREGVCWRQVMHYELQVWDGRSWGRPESGVWTWNKSYTTRWSRVGDSMVVDPNGPYVGDTLRWMIPGDTVVVRLRSIDSSGGVSRWMMDTLILSRRPFVVDSCPEGFVPVFHGSADSQHVVCVERYEHRDSSGAFARRVLFAQARRSCQSMSDARFVVDLCEESEWRGACAASGSRYGVIEEQPFYPQEFLPRYCNVGSGDSVRALDVSRRDRRCVSAGGVYDLPGQLQEWSWMVQKAVDSVTRDTVLDTVAVLKGSSYVAFQTADRTLLARCSARAYPARMRPKFVRDTVYIYRNGSYYDTLFAPDTTRRPARILLPDELPDTLLIYEVRDPDTGDILGEDYVDQREYRRRGGAVWIESIADGLTYNQVRTERVLILSGEVAARQTAPYFRDASVGYRCCARRR